MSLSRPFEAAGLRLVLPDRPLVPANQDIFQMDIARPRGGEAFRLWKGHESNSVRVTDTDKDRRQLVLLVHEQARPFEMEVRKKGRPIIPPDFRSLPLLRETPFEWIFRRWTEASLRRYLCGMDERHLFIAQFEGGSTVKDAHRRLKPAEVREADRSAPGRTLRQGEWFFVKPGPGEAREISELLAVSPQLLRKNESLGGNGRPHMADEIVRIRAFRVYARGRIRHPDHKTLVLSEWRRVVLNAEVRDSLRRNGVYWID